MGWSVLVVDDETLLRESLAIILASDSRISRVESVAGGAEAILCAGEFDVVVLDYEMPGEDGLTVAHRVLELVPDQLILMLTRHARPGLFRQALAVGVRGFMTKAAAPDHVLEAIATLVQGGRYVDPEIAITAITHDCPLTDRELDVLRLAGQGRTARSIATQLRLAPGTVRNYLSAALSKTHTTRKEEAVEYARARHWI